MSNDTLVRWEETRREYLSGAIVLMFGLSSASLAFCGALLTQDTVKLGGCRTFFFLATVGFFVLALFASVLITFTRLQDARITTNIVRKEADSMLTGYVERLRTDADRWGKWTWRLLYIQISTFCVGACLLPVSLWLIFYSKLFP